MTEITLYVSNSVDGGLMAALAVAIVALAVVAVVLARRQPQHVFILIVAIHESKDPTKRAAMKTNFKRCQDVVASNVRILQAYATNPSNLYFVPPTMSMAAFRNINAQTTAIASWIRDYLYECPGATLDDIRKAAIQSKFGAPVNPADFVRRVFGIALVGDIDHPEITSHYFAVGSFIVGAAQGPNCTRNKNMPFRLAAAKAAIDHF